MASCGPFSSGTNHQQCNHLQLSSPKRAEAGETRQDMAWVSTRPDFRALSLVPVGRGETVEFLVAFQGFCLLAGQPSQPGFEWPAPPRPLAKHLTSLTMSPSLSQLGRGSQQAKLWTSCDVVPMYPLIQWTLNSHSYSRIH